MRVTEVFALVTIGRTLRAVVALFADGFRCALPCRQDATVGSPADTTTAGSEPQTGGRPLLHSLSNASAAASPLATAPYASPLHGTFDSPSSGGAGDGGDASRLRRALVDRDALLTRARSDLALAQAQLQRLALNTAAGATDGASAAAAAAAIFPPIYGERALQSSAPSVSATELDAARAEVARLRADLEAARAESTAAGEHARVEAARWRAEAFSARAEVAARDAEIASLRAENAALMDAINAATTAAAAAPTTSSAADVPAASTTALAAATSSPARRPPLRPLTVPGQAEATADATGRRWLQSSVQPTADEAAPPTPPAGKRTLGATSSRATLVAEGAMPRTPATAAKTAARAAAVPATTAVDVPLPRAYSFALAPYSAVAGVEAITGVGAPDEEEQAEEVAAIRSALRSTSRGTASSARKHTYPAAVARRSTSGPPANSPPPAGAISQHRATHRHVSSGGHDKDAGDDEDDEEEEEVAPYGEDAAQDDDDGSPAGNEADDDRDDDDDFDYAPRGSSGSQRTGDGNGSPSKSGDDRAGHAVAVHTGAEGLRAEDVDSFLRSVPLFQALSETSLSRLLRGITVREYRARTIIFNQGQAASNMYVLESGEVSVIKRPNGAPPPAMASGGGGGNPMAALAAARGLFDVGASASFDETSSPYRDMNTAAGNRSSVQWGAAPLGQNAGGGGRRQRAATDVQSGGGHMPLLVRQGSMGSAQGFNNAAFNVNLSTGTSESAAGAVVMPSAVSSTLGTVVAHLARGDVFGERALLAGAMGGAPLRSASVVADTPVRCIVVSRALFNALLTELRAGLLLAVRRYGHDDPETLSLMRHVHLYRRVALSVSAPGTRDRESLQRLMSAFVPGGWSCGADEGVLRA